MAWINHIVRRGNIVIYPRYQASLITKPPEFCSNDIKAVKAALEELQGGKNHVRPQLDKVSVVGHSAGGNISAGMAAQAVSAGLPPFKAVMCVEPGKTWGPNRGHIPLESVSGMPRSTLLLAVVGDQDTIVRDIDACRIINESVNVPAQNKNLVTLVSDDHGAPHLVASHFAPAAPAGKAADYAGGDEKNSDGTQQQGRFRGMLRQRIMQRMKGEGGESSDTEGGAPSTDQSARMIDALDYYGTWKLFDALEDAALFGKDREYALGDTPQQRYMGKWSDGVPVKQMIVEVGHAVPKGSTDKVGTAPALGARLKDRN
jgi:hypothetical protein